jgi:hypothetical protein
MFLINNKIWIISHSNRAKVDFFPRTKVDFFPGQKLILSTILKEGQTVRVDIDKNQSINN